MVESAGYLEIQKWERLSFEPFHRLVGCEMSLGRVFQCRTSIPISNQGSYQIRNTTRNCPQKNLGEHSTISFFNPASLVSSLGRRPPPCTTADAWRQRAQMTVCGRPAGPADEWSSSEHPRAMVLWAIHYGANLPCAMAQLVDGRIRSVQGQGRQDRARPCPNQERRKQAAS